MNRDKKNLNCTGGGGEGRRRMGKKNSKLKQETIEELIRDTYCKFSSLFFVLLLMFFFCSCSCEKIEELIKDTYCKICC